MECRVHVCSEAESSMGTEEIGERLNPDNLQWTLSALKTHIRGFYTLKAGIEEKAKPVVRAAARIIKIAVDQVFFFLFHCLLSF